MRDMITLLKVDEIWASPVASTFTTLFDDVAFFAIIHLVLLSCLLLVSNGLLLALSRTSVVLGALPAHRKSDTMADAPVAADIHETLDVHLHGRTKLALDLAIFGDHVTDGSDLFIVPVPDFDVVIDPAFVENSSRQVAADSIDIGQTYLSMFVVW